MPQRKAKSGAARTPSANRKHQVKSESRFTVALGPAVAEQVERYARTADTSMSRAIAALVRLGLEGQEIRKRDFLQKLNVNLANEDPAQQDQLIDEFRTLILGH
jgi:hypothetical protein